MSIVMALALGPLAHRARRLLRRSPALDVVVLSPLVAFAGAQPAGSALAWLRLALILFVVAEVVAVQGNSASPPGPARLHLFTFVPALAAGLDGGFSPWSFGQSSLSLCVAGMLSTSPSSAARWAAIVFMLMPVLGRLT